MRERLRMRLVLLLLLSTALACSLPQKRISPDVVAAAVEGEPLSPEETKELLSETAGNWFYGQGLGDSTLKVGTAVVFPPYALVLLGNAGLTLAGYEAVGVSNFLPEGSREGWQEFYDTVTSVPGQTTARVANKEFRDQEEIDKRMSRYLTRPGNMEDGKVSLTALESKDPEVRAKFLDELLP